MRSFVKGYRLDSSGHTEAEINLPDINISAQAELLGVVPAEQSETPW